MNSILENELVKKYFGSCEHGAYREKPCLCALNYAGNVLQAMQEPIKTGDKYLLISGDSGIKEGVAINDELIYFNFGKTHPCHLRLPDKFQCRCHLQDICRIHPEKAQNVYRQKKECDILGHPCDHCGKPEEFHRPKEVQKRECDCEYKWRAKCPIHQPRRRDEVEEKINAFCNVWVERGTHNKAKQSLRELVRLARESK